MRRNCVKGSVRSMKGLELARAYYEQCGKPMLAEQFPELTDRIAVGLFGSGSECYGFDDAVSRDHDFEPGFCIFLPGEDVIDENTSFRLERAYARLPKEFEGCYRSLLTPVGGKRHGVFRAADYFKERCGSADGRLDLGQWLTTPQYVLSELTNGEIFSDPSGLVTTIRERLNAMPEAVLFKRLAGNLLLMNQAGQYNYARCLKRGEKAAAQLAANEFVNASLQKVFLLNRVYLPYYKWSFRALHSLPLLSETAEALELLLEKGNDEADSVLKNAAVEDVCRRVVKELLAQGFSGSDDPDLEKQASLVNRKIADPEVRNLDILSAV